MEPEDVLKQLNDIGSMGLELDVHHLLRMNNYDVMHGGIYIDPASDKTREYDLIAEKIIKFNKTDIVVRMYVECKKLSCDVYLSGSNSQINDVRGELWYKTEPGNIGTCEKRCEIPNFKDIKLCSGMNQVVKRIGKDDRIGSDKEVYSKFMQSCMAACNGYKNQWLKSQKWLKAGQSSETLVLHLPILIVPNDTLWYVDYTNIDDVTTATATHRITKAAIKTDILTRCDWPGGRVSHSVIENVVVFTYDQFVKDLPRITPLRI